MQNVMSLTQALISLGKPKRFSVRYEALEISADGWFSVFSHHGDTMADALNYFRVVGNVELQVVFVYRGPSERIDALGKKILQYFVGERAVVFSSVIEEGQTSGPVALYLIERPDR